MIKAIKKTQAGHRDREIWAGVHFGVELLGKAFVSRDLKKVMAQAM